MSRRKLVKNPKHRSQNKLLRARVQELEEALAAIRSGQVDALIVQGPTGDHVFTLEGAEVPYRVLVENINEGLATMGRDGTVLYANSRFAELFGIPLEKLIGSPLQAHILPSEAESYKLLALIERAEQEPVSDEISFEVLDGLRRTVRVSLNPLRDVAVDTIYAVVTDVTALIAANDARNLSEQELHKLSGRLLTLQDEERRRISRDLHDVTGQKLAALAMNLSQVERLIQVGADGAHQPLLTECKTLSKQVGEEIRTVSYLLHPPLLDELGLSAGIRWYVEGFARRAKIDVQIDIDPNLPRLPQENELALFRVVQESLTNIHRYAECDSAQVRLKLQTDTIRLEIEDHGKGMPPEILASGSRWLGVGLQGMRERMRQVSGTLEITSARGEGTKVVASLAAPARSGTGQVVLAEADTPGSP